MENKSVQELISEFSKLDKNDKKAILAKQTEILHTLIKQEYIYTLLDKKTTLDQFKNKSGNILTSGNSLGRPCFRIFSKKELAEKCAVNYGLTIATPENENQPLIFKVTTKGMIKTAYNAMFKGLFDIVIDDGANWIDVNVRDFVNSLYSYVGEEDLVAPIDFTLVNIVNMLKYTDKPIYSIMDFKSEDDSKKIQIFLEKRDAEKYALEKLKDIGKIKLLNIDSFNNLVVDNFVKDSKLEMSVVYGPVVRTIKLAKANFILNKML